MLEPALPAADAAAARPATTPSPGDGHRWTRTALALAVAAMGLVDLASALLSHPPARLLALRHLVPTDVLDTSRTFTLVAGALLLVTAWGLRRGKRRAYVLALLLCALSVPVNLLKAFDVEEATVAAALMFALGVCADAFRVRSRAWTAAGLRSRALAAAAAIVLYAVIGSWVIERAYGVEPSVRRSFAEAAYRLFGVGEPVAIAPPGLPHAERRVIEWFARSLPLLGVTFTLVVGIASLRPAAHHGRQRALASRVVPIVRDHGAASVSSFAVGDDVDWFFSPNGRAVIAYRFESEAVLGIGDPLGPEEELRPLLEAFLVHCRERDWALGFFQARPERLALYRAVGLRALHVGVEPILRTDRFGLEGPARGDVRRSSRRAGAVLETTLRFPDENPLTHAGADARVIDQMADLSAAWLRSHRGGEKGFCMGRFDPARLPHVLVALAGDPRTGRLEAFTTWISLPARRGWALDLMRRRPDAGAGAMELLVVRCVEAARGRGDALVSLSFSALAPASGTGDEAPAEPPEVARARELLARHLAGFYDFRGLFHWKKKFDPELEDRYLVHPGGLELPRIALALARAQSPGGWWSYLRRPVAEVPERHDFAKTASRPAASPERRASGS